MGQEHRTRINTEEKAKVLAAVWGTELIHFLAVALAIFGLAVSVIAICTQNDKK